MNLCMIFVGFRATNISGEPTANLSLVLLAKRGTGSVVAVEQCSAVYTGLRCIKLFHQQLQKAEEDAQ